MSTNKTRKDVHLKQPVLSSFFPQASPAARSAGEHHAAGPSKRPASPIDLTISDDDAQPPKKQKTTEPLFLPTSPSLHNEAGPSRIPASAGMPEQWRYDPSSPEQPPLSSKEDGKRKAVREKLSQKLSLENNLFRQSATQSEGDGEDQAEGQEETASNNAEASGDESDPQFKNLHAMFSLPTSKKGKKKAGPAKRTRAVEEIGPRGLPYTALEQQVRRLKEKHPGVLLMIEVGYKYKFFGEDAQIASKELSIVCYPDHNYLVASVPDHRRDIHLKKLLSRGHKVGIIEQTETAALKKASDNRNAPFERELTHLYTATT